MGEEVVEYVSKRIRFSLPPKKNVCDGDTKRTQKMLAVCMWETCSHVYKRDCIPPATTIVSPVI